MKTPMQELIKQLKELKDYVAKEHSLERSLPYQTAIDYAEVMLEKEKEVIMDAYMAGESDATHKMNSSLNYYNETFNTKEKMVEDEMDYKKEYYRLYQEVAEMLVENRRNYKTPMTPFELLLRWDEIREVKNTFNTKEK